MPSTNPSNDPRTKRLTRSIAVSVQRSKRASSSRLSNRPTATVNTPALPVRPLLRLQLGTIVRDAINDREYRVERFLGQGGFGAVYLVTPLPARRGLPASCVLKVTVDLPTWHREAYFGYLLRHVPALVEVYGSFAWAPKDAGAPLYCLVSEYMEEGDLASYLERRAQPWPEARARREIIRLLRAITRIHESGAVHRDITPANVFVASNFSLKLGDFGIAMHRVGRRDVAADAFAPRFAPSAIRSGARSWRPADDVSQIGQLFAALLTGISSRKITAGEVKRFACSAHAKSVLQRCIGERRKCFANASEMLEALEAHRPVQRKPASVRSLDGKNVVFTGGLSVLRAKAKKLARAAGALVQAQVSQETDIIVVGDQSPHWKAEAKGQKLLDVDREAERGHNIAIVTEGRFLKLVGHKRQRRA